MSDKVISISWMLEKGHGSSTDAEANKANTSIRRCGRSLITVISARIRNGTDVELLVERACSEESWNFVHASNSRRWEAPSDDSTRQLKFTGERRSNDSFVLALFIRSFHLSLSNLTLPIQSFPPWNVWSTYRQWHHSSRWVQFV